MCQGHDTRNDVAVNTVIFATSTFVPLAVGFFGLGTGYLIYAPQELFGFPARTKAVDLASGIQGVWMPGFMQFLVGAAAGGGQQAQHTWGERGAGTGWRHLATVQKEA
jgi:hypothetical protein